MILNYTSTLNSYLRVADKNVIFFPHNHHNVHISLEALNATDCSVDGIIGTNNKLTFPTNQRSENRDWWISSLGYGATRMNETVDGIVWLSVIRGW